MILRYENVNDALFKKVSKAYKTSLKSISESEYDSASYHEGKTTLKSMI